MNCVRKEATWPQVVVKMDVYSFPFMTSALEHQGKAHCLAAALFLAAALEEKNMS